MPSIESISSRQSFLYQGEVFTPTAKGVGELFNDAPIAVTPAEIARDKAICKDPVQPLLLIDSPAAVRDEVIDLGTKPMGDDFCFEKMVDCLADTLQAFSKLSPAERIEVQEKIADIQRDTAEKMEKEPKQNFEALQAEYYKSMFAMLNQYNETLSTSLMALREEIGRMSSQRELEFQNIQDRLERNKWFQWLGLGATAVTGAVAVAAIGTGWGAVAVGLVTLFAVALATDSILGDPVKHSIATIASGDDHQLIQDRMYKLEAASSVMGLGCAIVSIFFGGAAIQTGAAELLHKSASFLTALSQVSVAVGNAQNGLDQATIQELNHGIDRDDSRMKEETELLEESNQAFQNYARERRLMIKAKHDAAMQMLR